jgi:ABC-type phosphate transport system auxiliary subunit
MGASQSSAQKQPAANPAEMTQENVMLKQSKLKASQFRAKGMETKLLQNTERLQRECSAKLSALEAQRKKVSTDIDKLNTEFNRANLQLNAIKRRNAEAKKSKTNSKA